jgi:hypothetical protein
MSRYFRVLLERIGLGADRTRFCVRRMSAHSPAQTFGPLRGRTKAPDEKRTSGVSRPFYEPL